MPGIAWRAVGAVGTGLGAAAGRGLLPTAGAVGGTALGQLALQAVAPALPGPIGLGIGLLAGFLAGVALEARTGAGRLVGGMAGAVAGAGLGVGLGVAGWQPSPDLARVAGGFALPSLPRKLLDPDYIGHASLRHDDAARSALRRALPGDIIAAHHENVFEAAAVLTRLAGARADYTHAGIVTDRGTVIDMVVTGPRELPVETWLQFTHLAVLRPRYASLDSLSATVEGARAAVRTRTYDDDLRLDNDPAKEYCTEFVYRRLCEQAPEIHVDEQSCLGYRFVTPDVFFDSARIDVIYDSGSHFWTNHLSRYC